jgi:hypothetical protein
MANPIVCARQDLVNLPRTNQQTLVVAPQAGQGTP